MNTYPESGKQLIEQASCLMNSGEMLEARALLDGALLEYGFLPPEAELLRDETLGDSEDVPVASVGPRPGKARLGVSAHCAATQWSSTKWCMTGSGIFARPVRC